MSDQGGFDGRGLGGRPTLRTGEPVMARWFAVFLLLVVPVGLGVTLWAFTSFDREPVPAAARRPPGDVVSTHERGLAVLSETQDTELFTGCVEGIRLVGDEGGIATARRALRTACQLAESPAGQPIEDGLAELLRRGGAVRVAVFEATGVDATMRMEDGAPVIELNAKFQFDDGSRATPALVHELLHLLQGWPDAGPVTAAQELAAMQAQGLACERIVYTGSVPRSCLDAKELLDLDDPLRALLEAGYLN